MVSWQKTTPEKQCYKVVDRGWDGDGKQYDPLQIVALWGSGLN